MNAARNKHCKSHNVILGAPSRDIYGAPSRDIYGAPSRDVTGERHAFAVTGVAIQEPTHSARGPWVASSQALLACIC
jgi:hypothetical protein